MNNYKNIAILLSPELLKVNNKYSWSENTYIDNTIGDIQ